jgi:hypothetical protein
MLIVDALRGLHSTLGAVYKYVDLRQGANGPVLVPGIHELFCPHHPHPLLLTQV